MDRRKPLQLLRTVIVLHAANFALRGLAPIIVASAVCALVTPGWVHAQTTAGNLTGRVLSPDGGTVPGAAVTITDDTTHATRALQSDANGEYNAADLKPGTFTITVSAPGFTTARTLDVVLRAQQTVRIDVTLRVGQVATTVEVNEGAPVIETETAAITSTVSATTLANTSSNLLSTSDGTGDSGLLFYTGLIPGGSQAGSLFNWSVYGSRGSEAYYNVDGISSNSVLFGNMLGPSLPPFGMIEEVQYAGVDNKAELGQLLNITVVTKSGSNAFHGAIYDNYGNAALNARNYFANNVGRNISNDFGADVSGPIFRNKLFFFASGEFLRDTTAASINPNVPTAAMRTGDFSSLLTGSNPVTLVDPYTGAPFPNNVIPAGLLNAGALAWQQQFYPLPNYGPASNFIDNFRGTYPQRVYTNRYYVRTDYNFSDKNTLFARVGYIRSSPEVLDSGFPPSITGYRVQHRQTWQGVLSDTWVINPRMINVATFGVTHTFNHYGGVLQGQPILDELGVTGLPVASNSATGIPSFSISSFSSPFQLTQSAPTEQTVQFVDQFTYQRGKHTIKVGGEYRPMQAEQYFNPTFTSQSFAGDFSNFAYADFLLGLPTTTAYTYTRPPEYARLFFATGYVQDDWKVTPKLTVFYGGRYDYDSPAVDKNNVISSFDPRTGAVVVPNLTVAQNNINAAFPSFIPIESASAAGYPARSLRNAFTKAFYPRLGFSYRPFKSEGTVIRAGYGIYNENITAALFSNLYGGPFGVSVGYSNSITGGVPSVTLERPINATAAGISDGAVSTNYLAKNLRNPYIQQFNLTLEQDLGFSTGLRLSYVGNRSTQLVYTRNVNQVVASTTPFSQANTPYPHYYSVFQFQNGGYENYNALSAEVTHSFRHNLSFDGSFTWAKNLTDDDDLAANGLEGGVTAEDSYNLSRQKGNAEFDPRISVTTNLIYALPVGRGQRLLNSSSALEQIVGGWRVSGAYIADSGDFLTPMFNGSGPSNTNQFSGSVDRSGTIAAAGARTRAEWYNPAAYAVPANGNFGNAGYGIIEGPRVNVVNLALFKSFPIFRESQLELRGSFTNVLNHTNFGDPDTTITDAGAGQITSTTTNHFGGPRSGLITARLTF
jgi:hypothetical protein